MCNNHKKVKYFKACLIINDFIYKEQYNKDKVRIIV